jgi:sec-independent protein translocase protein TatA
MLHGRWLSHRALKGISNSEYPNYGTLQVEGLMIEDLLRPSHLLLILAIALLLFGPKKLGELGKGLGEGIRNFKAGLKDINSEKQ